MGYDVISREPFHLVGLKIRTNNEKAMTEIGQQWQKFSTSNLHEKLENIVGGEVIALYSNYEKGVEGDYDFMIGFRVADLDNVPEGLSGVTVEAKKYAVFTAKGKVSEAIYKTWNEIYEADINRTFAYDFEEYDANFDHSEEAVTTFYISIED